MEETDIFKTETIYDEMVHKEYIRSYTLSKRGLIWSHLLFEIVLLVMLVHFGSDGMIFRFLFWSVVYLAATFLLFRIRLKRSYQKILQSNNGQSLHNRIHFRSDGFLMVNPKNHNEVFHPYALIHRIVDTPKLVLLITRDKRCIILQKCWLLGGTPAELTDFLLEHCPQVRRIHGVALGKWVQRILIATMIAGSLFAFVLLFGAPIRPEESKTYAEITDELSALGITIREETIAEVESFYGEYPESGQSNAAKAQALLCMEGMGDFDMETLEWMPSDSGVYWMDMEVFFVDSIYTDFFAGLSAMDEELDFSNVQEDYSSIDIESGVGTLPVRFDWNGHSYQMDAQYNYDWFDPDILFEVCRIVGSAEGDKDLYYAFDGGQGFLLYYGTAQDARTLGQLTDLQFSTGASLIPQIF